MSLKILSLILSIIFVTVISIPLKKRESLINQNSNNMTTLMVEMNNDSTTTMLENVTSLIENSTFPTLLSTSTTQSTPTLTSTNNSIILSQSINMEENKSVEGLSPIMDSINNIITNQNFSQHFLDNFNGLFNVNESIFSTSQCYYEGTTIHENGSIREMTEDEINKMADFITKSVKYNSEWRYDEEANDWVKVDETVISEKDSWPEIPCFCEYCSNKK
uniref:Uncharacterized protein n=2 Tax=Strongyloides stercoralis TaxID=6248 RepID=A0A0K0DU59_STRER